MSALPHPLLKEAVLYTPDFPRLKWYHLQQALSSCGPVQTRGRSNAPGNRKKWTIVFSDLFNAEMALATLQGTAIPGLDPPASLVLSHSPTLARPSPLDRLFPQFISVDKPDHPILSANASDIFRWFRKAGPLVSVDVRVNIGREHLASVVEYWEEGHADVARLNRRILHTDLERMPPFTLRTYDPCNLYCAGLGQTFNSSDIQQYFGKFGAIVESRMVKSGVPHSYGFVSYRSREEAARAMQEMNGKTIGGSTILVRFHEPNNQARFRMPHKGRPEPSASTNPAPSETGSNAGTKTAGKKATDPPSQKTNLEEEKKRQDEEALRQKEAREREAEERRRKREAARTKCEAAERAEYQAQVERKEAEEEDRAEKEALAAATKEHEEAKVLLSEADQAVKEAERVLEEARHRRKEAAQGAIDAVDKKDAAVNRGRGAAVRFVTARREEARLKAAREQAEQDEARVMEETEDPVDEEARRQQELAESIRKMKELNELEAAERRTRQEEERRNQEAERLAQQERERKAQEEEARKVREEEERKAREVRAAKEREEREATRQRLYREALAREKLRCQRRDIAHGIPYNPFGYVLWTKEQSIARFQAISVEFDEIKFSESQPLVFESIPWPHLRVPNKLVIDDIDWSAVEEFFAAAKLLLGMNEYKILVEKSHRRFHPDKWRSRGLLTTVLDDSVRQGLEDAGNIVAQAITPLWLASKART